MTTYLFPGQGSQCHGMGADLFNEFPEYVQTANEILGEDLVKLCSDETDQRLNQTEYTQPALYVVNALTFLKKQQGNTTPPQFLAGHSLGEYNALFAANVFDFATGFKLVQKRGALMSQASGGGMAAVIGLSDTQIQQILKDHQLATINIANYNSNKQIVISGLKSDIEKAQTIFIDNGATMYIPLKVSGAFHSPYMQTAQNEFADFMNGFAFSAPTIPVIANTTALPYAASGIKEYLAKQITHSVLWRQSMEYVLAQGETEFQEVGPGKVLMGLINRIRKGQ